MLQIEHNPLEFDSRRLILDVFGITEVPRCTAQLIKTAAGSLLKEFAILIIVGCSVNFGSP